MNLIKSCSLLLLSSLTAFRVIAECGVTVCTDHDVIDCDHPSCPYDCTYVTCYEGGSQVNISCETGAQEPNKDCSLFYKTLKGTVRDEKNEFFICNGTCDCDFGQPDGVQWILVEDGNQVSTCENVDCGG